MMFQIRSTHRAFLTACAFSFLYTGQTLPAMAQGANDTANQAPSEQLLSPQDMIRSNQAAQAQEKTANAEAQDPVQNITNESPQDALPNVQQVKIRTEGFELGAERNITVYPGDNPAEMNQEAMMEDIRRDAFDAAVTGLFPLSPDDIQMLLQQYDETERATRSPPYDLPTPEVSVINVSVDPGVPPPTLKTAIGHVTTLNVLDITGAPWPIQDITWAGDFEVVEPEEGSHIIRITPLEKFTYGNLSVRLLTLKTPITFSLRVQRDSVHFRVDARVPEFGPFAEAQLLEGGTQLVAGNSTLNAVLDGAPPSGAVKLDVNGTDGRTTAFRLGGKTYVRTPLTLLSPGWESSVSSADGMNVYALNDTPVLLLSDQGRFTRASLSEKKDLFDE